MERDELLSEALGIGIDCCTACPCKDRSNSAFQAWNSKTGTNIPEIYKPAKTAPLQPALLKKQPKAKEGCKWKEMSCWVKHRESELSVMSLIHDFHSSSTKLLLLHIPKPAGRMICSCNQTWAWPFIIIIKSSKISLRPSTLTHTDSFYEIFPSF